jgi:CRISPR system Cascade subunit CasA
MNLINSPWLPFRGYDGGVAYRPPSAIADPAVADLALPRPDFQGAAWQWLIALLQTTWAPSEIEDWLNAWETPPDESTLATAFDTARHAFELFGDGPRFMQELDLPDNARQGSVAELLIDAPGEQTRKFNADHFIKCGIGEVVSPETAAIALYAMQINAPSGGKGYRTGLRGGGPLTTLVLPHDAGAALWHKLWLNVLPRSSWRYPDPDLGDWRVFPWLAPTRTSEPKTGVNTTADDVHPLHHYWAMPRRFRLAPEDIADQCSISGEPSERRVAKLHTTNYGYNYDGPWRHPLTPYRCDPNKRDQQPPWSIKGKQGGLGYRHWESLAIDEPESRGHLAAPVVNDFHGPKSRALRDNAPADRHARLWAFGYDMDNMKARCWYANEMPLLAIARQHRDRFLGWVDRLTTTAVIAAQTLRRQVAAAWFSRPGDVKGDFGFIEQRFFEATEEDFYRCLHELHQALGHVDDAHLPVSVARRWRDVIRQMALETFDDLAMSGDVQAIDMKRVTAARNGLKKWLRGGKGMKELIREADGEAT